MRLRVYRYIGPPELKEKLRRSSHCLQVTTVAELSEWVSSALPKGRPHGSVTATFIIDVAEQLWVADRHSEHVACANGADVLAAGEMVFEKNGKRLEVAEVSNQSTGYCPEPECWEVIDRVLNGLQLTHPPALTASFIFRRCGQCGTTNLVKDGVFECAVCDAPLSADWNYS